MVNTVEKQESATIEELLETQPYSLSTDGSNDQRDKQFPVVITNVGESGVRQHLLTVPILYDSATVFKLSSKELTDRNIPISNSISTGGNAKTENDPKHYPIYCTIYSSTTHLYSYLTSPVLQSLWS